MGSARATIEFVSTQDRSRTAGALLEEQFGVPRYELPTPMGVTQTDRLVEVLCELAERPLPNGHAEQRGRLIDSYIDAHKYIFGKRAILYGEQDLVVGLASLLAEIGIMPALCASGGKSGRVDGPRLLHLGYRGAQQLFDRIVNAVIATAQDASPVGYSYM